MAETIGLLTSVIGQLEVIRQWTNEVRQQYRHMKEVPEKCLQLDALIDEVAQLLQELQQYDSESMTAARDRQLGKISLSLEKAQEELRVLKEKRSSASRFRRFFRAKKVCETLDKLIDELGKLELTGLLIDAAASNQAATLQLASGRVDQEFVAQFALPPLPGRIVFDLDNMETYEGKLKAMVLRENVDTVGAVGVRVAAVHGMSGVGKTCAVTAVGNDPEVQKHYSGGVYFFSFAQNVKDMDIVRKLADEVDATGGHRTAKEIQNESGLDSALRKARSWFGKQRCLFICDDMWQCEGRKCGYLHAMRNLCAGGGDGCLLLSTRDLQVSEEIEEANTVTFKERDEQLAGDILLGAAGITRSELTAASSIAHESCTYILRRYGGLPVALGVAGRAIARIARHSSGGDSEKQKVIAAINDYKAMLERSFFAGEDLG